MTERAIQAGDPAGGDIRAAYVDKKRYLWPLSLVWPLMPILGIYLEVHTGLGLANWSTLIAWYVGIPIGDLILGADSSNPSEAAVPLLEEDRYYRYLTYLTVPVHYGVFLVSAWYVGTHELCWFSLLGLALSTGLINGIGINTGHELGHKKTKIERRLAKIVLAVVGYGHFYIEHNKGHHKDVATPADPASARFGETIFKFARRELVGAWRRAWDVETERLARKGKSPWDWENEILQPLAITVPLYIGLIALFGPIMIPFLFVQAAFGWWQLTSANYIEHYGLLRRTLPDGRYDRCQPEHSWNANHVMSNLILFHLQRHSDHHAFPTRRYQSLRNFDGLPELPSGYPAMFLLALIPPLWRRVMDPRLVKQVGGDMTKVNIDPDIREQILAQHRHPAG
jgi:alkane 1-monooxygenase